MVWFRKIYLLLRVPHWSKAIFVLLGVIYAEVSGYWPSALLAAFAFCLISSAAYVYNDLQDIEEDRLHPFKRHRPIASAQVSVAFAVWALAFLLLFGYMLAFAVSSKVAFILSIYLLINLFYNHWFRTILVLEILCIASGFMLRILTGTVGIGLPLTTWLAITAALLSLLIALGKRRLELNIQLKKASRTALKKYHPHILDVMINFIAIGCFITYALYVIYPRNEGFYFLLTIPFAGFGIWRFLFLIARERNNDDPVFLLFKDNLSCINLLCFFALTLLGLNT
ncbi:decaprenyl-phosphate phosphoribosyltransferase [Legionella londiniensis]|uniref:Phosphoribose diphosphate:decaprenyl-phosphate phosphoribosyltransferase n=2 Tax=Legionella londiniensis TaxID=45068 RepID=A0A0W0VKT0_9GAMM|nr:decaprenyl-phosphate phosphoribosyltransferase [Legionella londiniensis]KTD20711.1 phosphoribose diphosphate:decaprenyl-phosphate phosphoribosyltransferase [Legionella londiniensis]STX92816.1 4-hydroxybenzoate octaprenyltransferase [Legionella londiniensis]